VVKRSYRPRSQCRGRLQPSHSASLKVVGRGTRAAMVVPWIGFKARRGKVLSGRYQDWWLPLTAQKPECSADAGLVSHMKYMALPAVLDFSSFLPDIILHSIASLP
jgi:hypothetical protein